MIQHRQSLIIFLAVRLSFRKTEKTFADAAAEIDEYFKDASDSEPVHRTAEAIDDISSTFPSGDVSEITEAASTVPSVDPEEDMKFEASAMSGTGEVSNEPHAHHASPHRGIVPPQIFQAMAKSDKTSQK